NIKGGVITCIFDFETQSSKAVYINSGWTAITGYTLEELNKEMNGNPQALVYEEDKPNADLEYREQMQRGNEYALLYRVIRKGGVKIWVIDRGIATCLPDGSIQNQSIVTEVTEIKEQEESLRRLAQLDQLTDLYNKATFAQQTKMVLGRQSEKLHAVIILDIDDFKKVNDIMGHAYGDKVLESVSDCLKGVFRNRDVLGRIGGDEFMILMTDIPNMEAAAQKTKELCGIMHEIKIGNGEALTVSLGIALSTDGEDYDEIFQKADIALYRAKNSGKNQAVFFK
ncbi:MAG: sensor domain-containing diguanylate cyclase, partial [Oscillospiraceae bacterium]